MKGSPVVIALLNRGLALELAAVNQYLAQSKMCKRWGYHKLADRLYADYQEERTHAELLIERILFLEGSPSIKVGEQLRLGSNVHDQLKDDLNLELGAVRFYNQAISTCLPTKDTGSRETAEFLLKSSEGEVSEIRVSAQPDQADRPAKLPH